MHFLRSQFQRINIALYSFGVEATDANGCVGTKTITANICPTITINPPGILTGRIGIAYSWGFNASGGQCTGFKFRSSLSAVSCAIGDESSEVLFAGEAPGFAGLNRATQDWNK